MKKKFTVVLILLVTCFGVFSGCKTDFVNRFSKNVDEYEININLDEKEHIANCTQTVNYVNKTEDELEEVYFHLYPNAFKKDAVNKPVSSVYETKAYYNGFSEGGIDITKVEVNGKEVEILLEGTDNTLIKVLLEDGLNKNKKVSIYFEYCLTIPNVNHRFGYGENTLNLGNFYPVACVYENGEFDKNGYHYNGDPFYSNLANYEVNVKCNSALTVASTGTEKSKEEADGYKNLKYSAKAVRDFALVFSNKFKVASQNYENTKINYYYYGDENADKSLETSVKAVSTFNDMFGKYPYETLSVVESNFVHGGMEFPCLVLISDNLESYENYTETIVHEIAHQWWYGVVGNNQFAYGWLDEGLAEYSSALFFEKHTEFEISYESIINNANSSYCLFEDVYKDVFGKVDTTMNRKLNEFNTEPEYVYISYVKGMLMFDSLREVIGSKKFLSCVKYYYSCYMGKNAVPENLIDCFEKKSHFKLQEFFDSWINGKVVISDNA